MRANNKKKKQSERVRERDIHYTHSQGCHRRSAGPPRRRPARHRTLLRADKTEDRWRPGRPPPPRTPPPHRKRVYTSPCRAYHPHRHRRRRRRGQNARAISHSIFHIIVLYTHARRNVRAPPADRVENDKSREARAHLRSIYNIIMLIYDYRD